MKPTFWLEITSKGKFNRTLSGRRRGEKGRMRLLPLTTKEKSTPKKPPATQANTQQTANAISLTSFIAIRNTCLCFRVQSSALVASFHSLLGKQPGFTRVSKFKINKTPKVVSVECVGLWKHNGVQSEFGKIRETGKMCHVMSIDE